MARILLIDDDNSLRKIMAMGLADAGHQVVQAKDGIEGVACFRTEHFDLVITDLIMPKKEGIETIADLRRECPSLPIIAISGDLKNSGLYLQIAQQIGATRTLLKPFDLATLQRAAAEILAEAGMAPPKSTTD